MAIGFNLRQEIRILHALRDRRRTCDVACSLSSASLCLRREWRLPDSIVADLLLCACCHSLGSPFASQAPRSQRVCAPPPTSPEGRQSQGLEARFRFDSGSRPSPSCSARWARSSSRTRRRRTGTATMAASSTSSGVTFTSSSRGGRRARQPHRRTSGVLVGRAHPSAVPAPCERLCARGEAPSGCARAAGFLFFLVRCRGNT